jgi:hypothetical protein
VGFDRRTARAKGKLAYLVPCAERDGLLYVHAMVVRKPGEPGYIPDSDVPKSEWSGRTHAAFSLASGAMAGERAKTAAQGGPRINALIMMQPKIDGKEAWEMFAAEEATLAEQRRRAIDALPGEVVQCPPGPERAVSEQLAEGVRQEDGAGK